MTKGSRENLEGEKREEGTSEVQKMIQKGAQLREGLVCADRNLQHNYALENVSYVNGTLLGTHVMPGIM